MHCGYTHRHKMAARKLKFVDTVPEKFKCTRCKELLQDPHVTGCCGQHFCQKCIEIAEKKASSPARQSIFRHRGSWRGEYEGKIRCPSCRSTNYKHMRYLPLTRKINELMVYCPHKDNGCEEQVKLELIEEHSNKCEYQLVPCPHDSCTEHLPKKNLEYHTEKECLYRKVLCEYCMEEGEYYTIIFTHAEICPDYPLSCTNECGETNIKRKDMDDHRNECPQEFIRCTFAEVGCKEWEYREDLPTHLRENLEKHLSLLMAAHIRLKQEVEEMNTTSSSQ